MAASGCKTTIWTLICTAFPYVLSYTMGEIWEAIDIIQLVYYMLFVNVWKPYNVKSIFAYLKPDDRIPNVLD